MIVDERRSKILQIAEESGFVSLQRLVAEIDVSESTIRRDLEIWTQWGELASWRCFVSGDSLTDFDVRKSQASLENNRLPDELQN